jgi:predicted RNase H-like nuclease
MLRPSSPRALPGTGTVGGIDVGWSEKRASSAVALLNWDGTRVSISVSRFRATEAARGAAISKFIVRPALAVAIDGPLCTGLQTRFNYRFAERILTLGFQPLIGKPGQLSSPNGKRLHEQANLCAKLLVSSRGVGPSDHDERIHERAIVEAFPTSFLGLMLPNPQGLKSKRRSSSDIFYEELANAGILNALTLTLLPGHRIDFSYADIRNHDERAAIVCALTALCVTMGRYTAVGDSDGWIVLPPIEFIPPWARSIFDGNMKRLQIMGIEPLNRRKLGLSSGRYRPQTLDEFNASDEKIAQRFFHGSIEPEATP